MVSFFTYYFLKVHVHHVSNIKVIKKSQNSRNQCFSYYFCLMIEGSGFGSISLNISEAHKHMDPMDPDLQHWLTGKLGKGMGLLEKWNSLPGVISVKTVGLYTFGNVPAAAAASIVRSSHWAATARAGFTVYTVQCFRTASADRLSQYSSRLPGQNAKSGQFSTAFGLCGQNNNHSYSINSICLNSEVNIGSMRWKRTE